MILHILEAVLCVLVSYYAGRFWLRREVRKRLCPSCDGLGKRQDHLNRWRPCHSCHMSGMNHNH